MAPRRILVVHAGALGDFVLSLNIVGALRATWPQARVAALCRQPVAEYFVLRRVLDGWTPIETATYAGLFTMDQPILDAARQVLERFDTAIVLVGGPRSAPARRLGEVIPVTVAIDPRVQAGDRRHVTLQWHAALAAQGLTLAAPEVPVLAAPAERHGVIVHPGSGGLAKCWALEHFEAVTSRLLDRGVPTRYLVGPAELERHGDGVVDRLRRTGEVVMELDICALAERLSEAALYIGNDAGPTHLAAAVGTPVLALFTTTDPAVWGPRGPAVTAVEKPTVDSVSAAACAALAGASA